MAQQAVEKAVKAMLEVHRVWVRNQGAELANESARVLAGELGPDELDFVVKSLGLLTEWYTRSRYPTLIGGRVYGPRDLITGDVARDAVGRARRVTDIARRVLARHGID